MMRMVLDERWQKGLPDSFRPKFFCDYCGKGIEDAAKANFAYDMERVLEEPVDIVTLHKRPCTGLFEKSCEWDRVGTGELRTLPIQLGENMALDWGHARKLAGG